MCLVSVYFITGTCEFLVGCTVRTITVNAKDSSSLSRVRSTHHHRMGHDQAGGVCRAFRFVAGPYVVRGAHPTKNCVIK